MMSDNTRGVALMVLAMAAFAVSDACIKWLSSEMPLFQILLLRGMVTTLLLVPLCWRLGALRVRVARGDRLPLALRILAEIGAAVFFLSALFNMPLANVTAILQVVPQTVTLGAAVMFHEQLGWRRLLAIAIGFLGVLLIIRPGTDGFTIHAVLALVSVLFLTVRDLLTRRLSSAVPSAFVVLTTSGGVTVFAALASTVETWAAPSGFGVMLLLVSSAAILVAYQLSVMSVRVGAVGFVAPFRYTGLLWAIILGHLAFAEFPDPITLVGCAVIVATGLFTLTRERRLARRHAAAAAQRPPA